MSPVQINVEKRVKMSWGIELWVSKTFNIFILTSCENSMIRGQTLLPTYRTPLLNSNLVPNYNNVINR